MRQGWLLVVIGFIGGPALAQEAPPRPPRGGNSKAEAVLPRHDEDDAQLHDVAMLGRHGWACGDRGVVWKTTDAGETWTFVRSGVTCPLRSLCFLTDRVGWVAGGERSAYSSRPRGVLLVTVDGGDTWRPLGPGTQPPQQADVFNPPVPFPRLHKVKFFSPETGVVVGEPDDRHVSGMLVTGDGGLTWRDVPCDAAGQWRAADFVSPELGAVIGQQGAMGLLADGRIVPARNAVSGLPGLRAVALSSLGTSWLAGDGALVLQSKLMGAAWESPPRPLPEVTRNLFEFRAVCCRGKDVWLAGHPGSVIWHSPDDGLTWGKASTGQTLPIAALHMTTDQHGCAVGALGTILRTDDAGKTWSVVRGSGRRLAVLALQTRGDRVSWSLITALAGEEGYRTHVNVLSRRDVTPDGANLGDEDLRLSDAVVAAGGNGADVDWQFPISAPGQERVETQLVADWNQRTEGKLSEILTGKFVRDLRAWRPSVVVLDQFGETDALAKLLHGAVLTALNQAGDPTRYGEQMQLGLDAWKVERVCERQPAGSQGPIALDPFRYLPRLKQTLVMAVEPVQSRMWPSVSQDALGVKNRHEIYRETYVQREGSEPTSSKDFFAGLTLMPGSDARRELLPLSDEAIAAGEKLAKQQRTFSAYVDRFLGDPRQAGQLLGQLGDITRGMTARQAAWQLLNLAEAHHAQGQWELAELTLIELVERYPTDPSAQRAQLRLMQFWGSSETSWRRIRQSTMSHHQSKIQTAGTQAAVEQAVARMQADSQSAAEERIPATLPIERFKPTGPSRTVGGASERIFVASKFRYWQEQSLRIGAELGRKNPDLHGSASTQFALAAVMRQRGMGNAAEIYRRFLTDDQHPWWMASAGEIWMLRPVTGSERTLADCPQASERPHLDGVLSDPCWKDGLRIPLTDQPVAKPTGDRATVIFNRDTSFLYIAARVPRNPQMRTDGPKTTGRGYDADLIDFDRITILMDVDRDYATYYRFTFDQRGCTAEDLWGDATWNPKYHVSAGGNQTHWTVEIAIPFDELVPAAPTVGQAWNVSIVRTIPGVGLESWTHPAATTPQLEKSGLLRFGK